MRSDGGVPGNGDTSADEHHENLAAPGAAPAAPRALMEQMAPAPNNAVDDGTNGNNGRIVYLETWDQRLFQDTFR